MLVLHLNCWRILQSKKVKNTLSYEKCILKWYLLSGPQIRVRNEKLFFLYPIQNIHCGYSKEPSQWDGSFEHPKHMFKSMSK